LIADPRRYGAGDPSSPILRLAQDERHRSELTAALRKLAAAGEDAGITAAFASAPSQNVYARVWRALCAAVEQPARDDGVGVRVFAIPWVIVCTAGAAASLPGVLPDVESLARVLEAGGVFGASRSLGLGNALVSIETLEALRPSEVMRMSSTPALRDMAPAPIAVERGVEEVHVRFLLGAAIAPAHAPDIVETGANVGKWGTPALRAMAAQLAAPGVQILPMPRPPAGIMSAAWHGRRAGVETAFNLFVSNTVRRFRSSVGDPQVALSSHAGGELRVTLSTPFDDALVEGFRWPLHPADDLGEVERAITSMLQECRVGDPQVLPDVLPDRSSTGAALFPRL
jgi:hypothetical protein